jgi:guanosine-3',5'-bis(diphosphate) 3'-pyrophosphohydrolase
MAMKLLRKYIKSLLVEKFNSEDFKDVYATARMAHVGQKRRSGEDYFSHPSEVRNIVRRFYPKDHVSQLAALLHDSSEDAPGLSVDSAEEMEEFIRGSISSEESATEIIRVVRALTHEKGGDYLSYVVSLLGDQPSLRVKLADMLHNLSSAPSPKQKRKYQSALIALSDASASPVPNGISSTHWESLLQLTHED